MAAVLQHRRGLSDVLSTALRSSYLMCSTSYDSFIKEHSTPKELHAHLGKFREISSVETGILKSINFGSIVGSGSSLCCPAWSKNTNIAVSTGWFGNRKQYYCNHAVSGSRIYRENYRIRHKHICRNDVSIYMEKKMSSEAVASSKKDQISEGSSSSSIDPFSLVRLEIDSVSERLRRCIVSEIPTLERAAEYFFRAGAEGKRLRSTILLLMSNALAASPPDPTQMTVDDAPPDIHPLLLRRRQQRIAEITELIHVASLLHDDVIDEADTRRGLKALNSLFGNKVAILAGDFLLARASVSLASLKNPEVIALMSQVLEHLVAGEVIQLTSSPEEALSMDLYLKKSFYKTASLIANSCKSVAVLSDCSQEGAKAAWDYGRHIGLAFQLVDDILDFTGSAAELGKPACNDVRAGLATAPMLFAAEEVPELVPLIRRRFRGDDDVSIALDMVRESKGVEKAKQLAARHAEEASKALLRLPTVTADHAFESKQALHRLTEKVLSRRK